MIFHLSKLILIKMIYVQTFISKVLVVLVVPNVNAKVADAVDDGPKLK